jgi:hypothetical protein
MRSKQLLVYCVQGTGLYLRLGQLLVPDGTVMLAFDASRPWKRCVEVLKRLPLSGFLPLDDTAP